MIAHYKMQKVSGLREQQDVRRSSELVVFSQIIYIYIYINQLHVQFCLTLFLVIIITDILEFYSYSLT